MASLGWNVVWIKLDLFVWADNLSLSTISTLAKECQQRPKRRPDASAPGARMKRFLSMIPKQMDIIEQRAAGQT